MIKIRLKVNYFSRNTVLIIFWTIGLMVSTLIDHVQCAWWSPIDEMYRTQVQGKIHKYIGTNFIDFNH